MNEFYYRSAKNLGQNLFCCPCSALVTDLTGEMCECAFRFVCKQFVRIFYCSIVIISSLSIILHMDNAAIAADTSTLGCALLCVCVGGCLIRNISIGQEVASYWYSTVRRYNYFKDINLLHTNVNAGHFTQMVWVKTKYFGIGKATSKTGKIFVAAFYLPKGDHFLSFCI